MRGFYKLFCILLCFKSFSQNGTLQTHAKVIQHLKPGKTAPLKLYSDSSVIISRMAFGSQLSVLDKKLAACGKLKTVGENVIDSVGNFITVYNKVKTKKGSYVFHATYNATGQLTGLGLDSADASNPGLIYNNNLVKQGNYRRNSIVVKTSPDIQLPGYLYLPKATGSYPLVILVHGSGAHDRFCTIGPNKIFMDIAMNLVQKNIAVLLYDKVTYVYATHLPFVLDSMSYREETVNDAVAAFRLGKSIDEIDGTRIFIAGHSQGALCGPLIAKDCEGLRGLILLAAPARPLLEIMPEQLDYLATVPGTNKEQFEAQSSALKWLVKNALKPDLNLKSKVALPFGTKPKYWLFDRSYKPTDMAKSLTIPILLVQGGRDYNVSKKDYNLWLSAMKDKTNFKSLLFEDLDHMYFKGEGMARAEDVSKPNHVSEKVTNAVAEFILEGR